MMVGTSQHELGIPFIGFLVGLMANSIFYTWLYNNTKQSLWSAILLHWLYTYAAQVLLSGVTRSPLYNWLECLPYVVMAFVVILMLKPHKLSRLTAGTLPKPLNYLGLVIGVPGIISTLFPAFNDGCRFWVGDHRLVDLAGDCHAAQQPKPVGVKAELGTQNKKEQLWI